jgi:hypothetical protein
VSVSCGQRNEGQWRKAGRSKRIEDGGLTRRRPPKLTKECRSSSFKKLIYKQGPSQEVGDQEEEKKMRKKNSI